MDANDQAERVFIDQMPNFRNWHGWFALVGGNKLGGVFATFAAARAAGLAMYGDGPVLIRQIPAPTAATHPAVVPPTSPQSGKRRKGEDDKSRYVA